MADAIVSSLMEELTSIIAQEIQEEVRLVVGVGKEVKKLSSNLRAIQAVLNDAEQRQVKEERVRVWLDQLKDASYDMEDVLDEWNTARLKLQIEGVDESALVPKKKVCFFFTSPCSCFGLKQIVLRHDIAHKIREINENLVDIAKEKDMFNFHVYEIKSNIEKSDRMHTTSLVDESEICGRDYEKNAIISKLLSKSSEEQNPLHIISLVGMGGVGKTTLAQLAYYNVKVKRSFDKTIWICVSDSFDEFRIAKAIIEALKGSASNLSEFQSLIQHIRETIVGQKIFVVLDDVWNEDYSKWEPFYHCLKNSLHGSKILITTRKETVARIMGSTDIIPIKELTEEKCWSLFKQVAFFGRSIEECEKLEAIGKKIARKCKGLPLAAKTIGCLLRSKKTDEEWQRILNSDLWKIEELEKGLLPTLLLSYNDLPSVIKRCFSYCAVYPKDFMIEKDDLVKLWMALGYLGTEQNTEIDIIGREYVDILVARSFFQPYVFDAIDDHIIGYRMHDIIHDFAIFLRRNECLTVEINNCEDPFINSFHEKVRHSMLTLGKEASFPVSISVVKRLRSLLIKNKGVENSSLNDVLPELFKELKCLRIFDIKENGANHCLIKEIPEEVGNLIHLRYINLSGQAIKKLPQSLCELYNLQMLDITKCKDLSELPQGFGKLINMRYLLNGETHSLAYMPAGVGRLTSLRVIKKLVVGGSQNQGCTLESLKNLNLLRECCIRGLGNVLNVGETKGLGLEKKENLVALSLQFDSSDEQGRRKEEDEQLLQALQPPPNLKELTISSYRGNTTVFSNWMMSLTNVRILYLSYCKNWEHCPPLGKLPSLEKLDIWLMIRVKSMGNEFLGILERDDDGSSSSFIAFPKLKFLVIGAMFELEEWDYGITRKGQIMPRLSSVRIWQCPKLKALPDYLLQPTTLQFFEIVRSPILKERYKEGSGEDWPKISHIPSKGIY